jgi:hypothetical protein
MQRIDSQRGDVSRSRFLLRLIENAIEKNSEEGKYSEEMFHEADFCCRGD